ncbi:hypothetical protein C8J57DRAFT_1528493 [Mycena rebaudengoi]|nr:hypothetical protein C8J57DRAFT_1528493 [Mycena rebaudengoi]
MPMCSGALLLSTPIAFSHFFLPPPPFVSALSLSSRPHAPSSFPAAFIHHHFSFMPDHHWLHLVRSSPLGAPPFPPPLPILRRCTAFAAHSPAIHTLPFKYFAHLSGMRRPPAPRSPILTQDHPRRLHASLPLAAQLLQELAGPFEKEF